MCGCADKVTGPDNNGEGKTPIELRGSVDRIPVLEKEKAFYLYALLSPGDEWTAFYIDKDNAKLGADGVISTGTEHFWPQDDNMYRFVGVMNAADQAQPVVNMNGPAVSLSAGDTPVSDLLLSNNLSMRRTSVDDKMVFRHVMTQVVFEMAIDDAGDKAYTLTGTTTAGKQTGTYSILATPRTDLATVADDAADYTLNLALEATAANRTPRSVYYLVPDGSALTTLTGVKLNGADDTDIPLLTEQGDPVTLKSGNSYTVTLHVTQGVVSATIGMGEWLEEDLGDQNADVALSEVKWTLSYPSGVDKISKLEVVGNGGKTYFASLDGEGNTLSPVDLPAAPQTMAVWLGNARVELRPEEYTFADNKLDINVSYVTTAQELADIELDGTYRQAAHIDLGAGHTPIGTSTDPFTGTFDGGGYRMENLKFATSGTYRGLFGYNSGTIRNVTIGKCTVTGMTGSGGLVCASNNAGGMIEECVNLADFNASGLYIGGMVGVNRGTINECENYGAGSSTGNYMGGVVGQSVGTGLVTSCRNYGIIASRAGSAGGIVGFVWTQSVIADCVNSGAVSATGSNTGGIAGFTRDAGTTITRCVNTGSVLGGNTYTGGIAGITNTAVKIDHCINTGTVKGTLRVGGIAGGGSSLGATTITACLNSGAVSTTLTALPSGTNYCYVGGIIGTLETGTVAATLVTACVNTGTISSRFNGTGGIVGMLRMGTVAACYSVGDVLKAPAMTIPTSGYFGGVAGLNWGGASAASYWGGDMTVGCGPSVAAGTPAQYTKMSATEWPTESTHAGWKLASNGGYWESLGSWNGGTPTYPTLAGLPTIP